MFVVQHYLASTFHQKQLQTLDARVKFVSEQFKSDDDHPFMWREYSVGDITNHLEIGGYQTVRVYQLHRLSYHLTIFIDTSRCLSI